jgi:hypothetical protein
MITLKLLCFGLSNFSLKVNNLNKGVFEVLTAAIMGYNAVLSVESQLTFRRKMSSSSLVLKNKPSQKPA